MHRVCHHAIYLDRTFNAAHFLQSQDRIHRFGLPSDQETIIEIVECRGTVDETVHQRRDGSAFDVEISSSEILIEGTVYRQSFIRDISVRKEADALLRQRNAELDRFNRAAVDRELEMIELKRRVNALSAELGREPPYPLAFLDDDRRPPPVPAA